MNQQQITQIALEVGQLAGAVLTVATSIPASQAPTWLPIAIGVLTAIVTIAKQHYGNTPQNVPGSTAAAIASGAIVAGPTAVAPAPVATPALTTAATPVYPKL